MSEANSDNSILMVTATYWKVRAEKAEAEIERLRRLIAEPWKHMAYEQGRRDAIAALSPPQETEP